VNSRTHREDEPFYCFWSRSFSTQRSSPIFERHGANIPIRYFVSGRRGSCQYSGSSGAHMPEEGVLKIKKIREEPRRNGDHHDVQKGLEPHFTQRKRGGGCGPHPQKKRTLFCKTTRQVGGVLGWGTPKTQPKPPHPKTKCKIGLFFCCCQSKKAGGDPCKLRGEMGSQEPRSLEPTIDEQACK